MAKKWREVPIGGAVLEPGSSESYHTGTWRSRRPRIDLERCSHCLLCWVFCPDGAILTEGGRVTGIDLDHCKGCGICARECPRKCIDMFDETEG